MNHPTAPRRPSQRPLARKILARAISQISVGTLAAASLLALPQIVMAQSAPLRQYDIPAGSMESVLSRFGREAGITLSFAPETTAGMRSSGLHGGYSIASGLDTLLAGSGLQASVQANGSYLLRKTAAAEAARPASSLPAIAVTATADGETATGPAPGYVARRSASGTKTDSALLETPQSISVVTREQMDAQNIQSVPQALRYTPGVVSEQRGVNTDSLEYIYARGFQIDEYWNGLRLPNNGFNITSMDPYMFERVELLRGPASVLYGQTSPGGLLSLVSKRPTATPLHEIMLQTGSHGRKQAAFDFGGPLDEAGKFSYRLTANVLDTGTQTDFVRQQRTAVAAALTWRPDSDTHLTAFVNYQKDPQAGVYNFVPAAGTVLPGKVTIPRSFFAGDPDYNSYEKEQESIGYEFEHKFNDTWSFKQNLRVLRNSLHIRMLDDSYGLNADGVSIGREAYKHDGSATSAAVDNQLQAIFNTGAVKHTAIFGVDYQRLHYDHTYTGQGDALAPSINIANPVYGQGIGPQPDFMYGSSSDDVTRQLGFYAQDQIRWNRWAFLLGGRQDQVNSSSLAYKTGKSTSQSASAFTWRTGAVYLFDNGVSPYLSYSTSFQPAIGTDAAGNTFKPTEGKQYEAGVKFQPPGSDSSVTVAVFDLTQTNVLTADPVKSNFKIQTGEVRSQGVELEARATLAKNLQAIATYTYTDIKNTRSNTNNLDKVPAGIPRSMAALWLNYDFTSSPLAGLQVGAGARYMGASYGDSINSFKVPAVTLLDLSLRYDLARLSSSLQGWSATVSGSNLTNKNTIASCSSNVTCVFGMERAILANVKYKW
ncbi:TonB-dependent siderophore receptor [Herbaspirillum autotrophicum]|uniref:TonB-dependent siderophore receptor n=1 Tax=Herbaspirillum autotrophicum TaxID=180195 RepID=UPI00067AEC55|nr:TonB-dependent siderophore receptor [Herbaspirillum autotrophicum]